MRQLTKTPISENDKQDKTIIHIELEWRL